MVHMWSWLNFLLHNQLGLVLRCAASISKPRICKNAPHSQATNFSISAIALCASTKPAPSITESISYYNFLQSLLQAERFLRCVLASRKSSQRAHICWFCTHGTSCRTTTVALFRARVDSRLSSLLKMLIKKFISLALSSSSSSSPLFSGLFYMYTYIFFPLWQAPKYADCGCHRMK